MLNYTRMETILELPSTSPNKNFKLKLFLAIPLVLLISFLCFNNYQNQIENKILIKNYTSQNQKLLRTINNFKHQYRNYLIHKKAVDMLNDHYNSSCITNFLKQSLEIDYDNLTATINYEKIKQHLSYNYSFYDEDNSTNNSKSTQIINIKNYSQYPYNMICGVESYHLTSKNLMTNDSYSYNLYESNGSIYMRLFSMENYLSEPMKQYISDYIDNNYLDVYNYDGNNHYTINNLYIYDKDEYINKIVPDIKSFKILLNNIK